MVLVETFVSKQGAVCVRPLPGHGDTAFSVIFPQSLAREPGVVFAVERIELCRPSLRYMVYGSVRRVGLKEDMCSARGCGRVRVPGHDVCSEHAVALGEMAAEAMRVRTEEKPPVKNAGMARFRDLL